MTKKRILSLEVRERIILKDFLKLRWKFSSRLLNDLKKGKHILVNGKSRNMNYILNKSDKVIINLGYEKNTFAANYAPLDIIYEDEWLMAINKDPYICCHPTRGNKDNTLLNAISLYINENKDSYKIRFINRIDRDTSGVVLIAKSKYIHSLVNEELSSRDVYKEYIAIVDGKVNSDFNVKANMTLSKDGIKRMVSSEGKFSSTNFEIIKIVGNYSILKAYPKTGRTHQIRVHLASSGFPIYADRLYGREIEGKRMMLHCLKMKITHPISGKEMIFESELKDDMKNIIFNRNV